MPWAVHTHTFVFAAGPHTVHLGGGGGGGGGGGNLVSVRRTRRWRHSNGLVYEEETELVHMGAGSGGNSSTRSVQRLSSLNTQHYLSAAAAVAVGDAAAGPAGGRMFWHRGGGGFSWSWRRRNRK